MLLLFYYSSLQQSHTLSDVHSQGSHIQSSLSQCPAVSVTPFFASLPHFESDIYFSFIPNLGQYIFHNDKIYRLLSDLQSHHSPVNHGSLTFYLSHSEIRGHNFYNILSPIRLPSLIFISWNDRPATTKDNCIVCGIHLPLRNRRLGVFHCH